MTAAEIVEELGGEKYGIYHVPTMARMQILFPQWFKMFKRLVPGISYEVMRYALYSIAHGVSDTSAFVDVPKSASEFVDLVKKKCKSAEKKVARDKAVADLGQDNKMHISFKMTRAGVIMRLHPTRLTPPSGAVKSLVVPLAETQGFFVADEMVKRDDWFGLAARKLVLRLANKPK